VTGSRADDFLPMNGNEWSWQAAVMQSAALWW